MQRSYAPLFLFICIFFNACTKRLDDSAIAAPVQSYLDPNAESLFLHKASSDARVNARSWQGIPSIGATNNGKEIYVAWYTGGNTEGPGNFITVALSLDRARTWLNDELIIYPQKPDQIRFFDPGIWRDKDDNIWLTWAKSRGSGQSVWDNVGGVWTSKLAWDGKNIRNSEVKEISKGVMLNKPTYIADKKYILFPVSLWGFPPTSTTGCYIYKAGYSDAVNSRVDTLEQFSKVFLPDSIRTFDEHQIVETGKNGSLLCLIRTWKGTYYSKSSDYGKTWSDGQPFTAVGPTAVSRFHISKLKSGNLLLILNNSTVRTNMTAFLSKDGGKTWPYKLVIDRRSNISYPDAIETGEGFIHVVYDRERTGAKEILYCRFKEKDIFSSNEKGIIRSQVNAH